MTTLPESHTDLLDAAGVTTLTAVTPNGQLQSTAVWYLRDDDGTIKVSINDTRKKLRNLQADPRVTLLFIDPSNPFRTLEVRGTAAVAVDEGRAVMQRIGEKYSADMSTFDAPGDTRYTVTVTPETVNARP